MFKAQGVYHRGGWCWIWEMGITYHYEKAALHLAGLRMQSERARRVEVRR